MSDHEGPALITVCNQCKHREIRFRTQQSDCVNVHCNLTDRDIASTRYPLSVTITPEWCPLIPEKFHRKRDG